MTHTRRGAGDRWRQSKGSEKKFFVVWSSSNIYGISHRKITTNLWTDRCDLSCRNINTVLIHGQGSSHRSVIITDTCECYQRRFTPEYSYRYINLKYLLKTLFYRRIMTSVSHIMHSKKVELFRIWALYIIALSQKRKTVVFVLWNSEYVASKHSRNIDISLEQM